MNLVYELWNGCKIKTTQKTWSCTSTPHAHKCVLVNGYSWNTTWWTGVSKFIKIKDASFNCGDSCNMVLAFFNHWFSMYFPNFHTFAHPKSSNTDNNWMILDFFGKFPNLKGTVSPRENFWYVVGGPPLIPKTIMKISKKNFKLPKN